MRKIGKKKKGIRNAQPISLSSVLDPAKECFVRSCFLVSRSMMSRSIVTAERALAVLGNVVT